MTAGGPLPKIIALAGGIGSGKSTIARAIADHLGCPIASFGDYVRSVSKASGQNPSRDELQRSSENLIRSLGWHGLTRDVIARAGWRRGQSLVIDGIRHADVISALNTEMAPSSVFLVYLDVEPHVRAARVSARDGVSVYEFEKFDSHTTESSVGGAVRSMADVIVSADGDATQTIAAVLRAID